MRGGSCRIEVTAPTKEAFVAWFNGNEAGIFGCSLARIDLTGGADLRRICLEGPEEVLAPILEAAPAHGWAARILPPDPPSEYEPGDEDLL